MPKMTFKKTSRGLAAAVLASMMAIPSAGFANAPPVMPEKLTYVPAQSLEGNYLAAYVAGRARDAAAAAAYYRAALSEDPKNRDLMDRAFIAFLANNDMPEAFRLADQLLVRDPTNNLAHLAVGVRDFQEGKFNAARKQFSAGSRKSAPDLGATLLTAWTWTAEGNLQKGLTTAAQLKGTRGFDVFRDYHTGLMAMVGDKPQQAEQLLQAAYEGDSNTLRIVEAYGRMLSQRGNKDKAASVFEAFQRLAPSQPTARWALSELQAGKTLPPLIENPAQGVAEVLYSLGAAGNVQGDELAAVLYLRLALHLDPKHDLARIALADSYERIGQVEQSVQLLQDVPKTPHLYTDAVIQKAYGLEQIGRADEAEKTLEELAAANPKESDVALALGNILRVRGAKEKDPEKSKAFYLAAAKSYTKALEEMAPGRRANWSILFMRGTCYERAKQWDKAETDLKKALSLVPDDQPQGRAQVMNYLAYSWVDANTNIDEAFKLLQNAIELSPRDGMIIDSLGWAYYRLGRYPDAVRELERAVEYKPGDPTINDHLGDAYWKVGRENDARFQWNHARDSSPEPEDLQKILDKIEHGLK